VTTSGVDQQRVASVKEREDRAFVAARPRGREIWRQDFMDLLRTLNVSKKGE